MVIAAAVLSVARVATAQTPDATSLKRLSLEELGNVVVTSVSKEPEMVWQTPAAVYVLTNEDIVRSGVTSVPDALRLVPGVEVARIDTSRNWVVGIRGFGDQYSKSVLVLVDGRTVYTPLWAGVHWPIQDVLLEDVDRIEVIRGPGGTIWGANAEDGVINIITKSARDTHGIYATAAAGNVDQAIGGFRFGGGREGLDYRGYVKGISRAPQYHTDGREFDTWSSGQAGFRLDWQANRDHLMIEGDLYKAELGESVRVATFAPPASFLVDNPVDASGGNVMARWRRTFSSSSDFTVQAFVDHTYRLGTDFGERRTTLDVDTIHRFRLARRHEVSWGLGARTSPGSLIQTYSFADFEPHDETLNLFSAFGEDSIDLVAHRLTAVVGVKLERNSYTGLETQPSARLLWTPSSRQTVWGGVTRAVRIPSRVDEDISVALLANPAPPVYAILSGNHDIDAERVIGAELGYRTLVLPSVYVDISAFHNNYDDIVDLGQPHVEPRTADAVAYTAIVFPWINGIEGTTKGFEIAPDWQPSSLLRLRGSYSFIDLALVPKPANTRPVALPTLAGSTPRHEASIQALITVPRFGQIDPVYRYVSARTNPVVPGYHTADVHVAFNLPASFELSLVGQNLLQPHHAEWARDPGPTVEIRRAFYARIAWRH